MSSPTPPPASSSNPARKKPSGLASCILLGLILGALGAMGGGAFWAYKKFVRTSEPTPSVASTGSKTPAPPAPSTEPKPPVAEPTPAQPPLIESLIASNTPAPTPVPTPTPPPTVPPAPDTTTPPPAPPVTPPPLAANDLKPNPLAEPLPEPPVPTPSTEPDPVVAPERIQTFAQDSPEVAALKADADLRIDEAPPELYSNADKERVRDAIRQSKRLTRVATLQFGAGAASLGSNEKARLKKALLSTEAETLLSDPQAVFFIIGFADATGASDVNRRISQKRAAGVADVLKSFKVPNSTYAVGIGATTLLSTEKQSRNRATEVWIVLP